MEKNIYNHLCKKLIIIPKKLTETDEQIAEHKWMVENFLLRCDDGQRERFLTAFAIKQPTIHKSLDDALVCPPTPTTQAKTLIAEMLNNNDHKYVGLDKCLKLGYLNKDTVGIILTNKEFMSHFLHAIGIGSSFNDKKEEIKRIIDIVGDNLNDTVKKSINDNINSNFTNYQGILSSDVEFFDKHTQLLSNEEFLIKIIKTMYFGADGIFKNNIDKIGKNIHNIGLVDKAKDILLSMYNTHMSDAREINLSYDGYSNLEKKINHDEHVRWVTRFAGDYKKIICEEIPFDSTRIEMDIKTLQNNTIYNSLIESAKNHYYRQNESNFKEIAKTISSFWGWGKLEELFKNEWDSINIKDNSPISFYNELIKSISKNAEPTQYPPHTRAIKIAGSIMAHEHNTPLDGKIKMLQDFLWLDEQHGILWDDKGEDRFFVKHEIESKLVIKLISMKGEKSNGVLVSDAVFAESIMDNFTLQELIKIRDYGDASMMMSWDKVSSIVNTVINKKMLDNNIQSIDTDKSNKKRKI